MVRGQDSPNWVGLPKEPSEHIPEVQKDPLFDSEPQGPHEAHQYSRGSPPAHTRPQTTSTKVGRGVAVNLGRSCIGPELVLAPQSPGSGLQVPHSRLKVWLTIGRWWIEEADLYGMDAWGRLTSLLWPWCGGVMGRTLRLRTLRLVTEDNLPKESSDF